jgi:pilus assembly protein CpaE
MNQSETISFPISSQKLSQLDMMAKVKGCDRSHVLNDAVDAYLGIIVARERSIESTQPMNEEDAGEHFRSPTPMEAELLESVPREQDSLEPPIVPPSPATYMFLDEPASPRKFEESRANIRFPILGPGKTKGRLLVFLSTKGGAGVTTVACNFAVSLARESGKRVLLIDLNLQRGDVTLNLGIQPQYTTLNALLNADRLDAIYLFTLLVLHSSGLFVLGGPSELTGEDISREAICKLLAVAGEDFDYVVVDAGTTFDTKHIYTFDESSIIYVVTQVGIAELRNSNRLISKFPKEAGPKIEVVINRFDPKSQEIDDHHLTKALTRPARWKIPNDYAAVRRMQRTSTPLSVDSPISQAILQMTKCVCGTPCALEPSKGISFFGWKLSRK